MTPPVGCSNPPIIRSVVVLPQPDGPSRLKNSPSSISRSMPSTAGTSPKRFVTWLRRTATGTLLPTPPATGRVPAGEPPRPAPIGHGISRLRAGGNIGRGDGAVKATSLGFAEPILVRNSHPSCQEQNGRRISARRPSEGATRLKDAAI